MSGDSIKVLVADDQAMVRKGAVMLIEAHPGITVVAQATAASEVMPHYLSERPDVVLLDLALGADNGIDVARALIAHDQNARIVFISNHDQASGIRLAYRLGAMSYLSKVVDDDVLVHALRLAARGEKFYEPHIMEILGMDSIAGERKALSELSDEQQAAFLLLAKQRPQGEIAAKLGVGVRTVGNLTRELKDALGLNEPIDFTLMAVRLGLIDPHGRT